MSHHHQPVQYAGIMSLTLLGGNLLISYFLPGLVRWLVVVFLPFLRREGDERGSTMGFSQQAKAEVAVAHMFFPVRAP